MTFYIAIARNLAIVLGLKVLDRLNLLGMFRQTSLFNEMSRSPFASESSQRQSGKSVLFVSFKGTWRTHLAWEYVLSHALRLRGARCAFLMNDNFFPKCDVRIHNNATETRAWVAHAYSRVFAKYLGLPVHWVSRFVPEAKREQLRAKAFDTPYEELCADPIAAIVRASAVRFYRRASVPDTPAGQRVFREFIYSGLLASEALKSALQELKPDTVIVANGKMYAENLTFRICRERGIDVFTYERGKIRNTINFVRNQISVDWNNDYAWKEFSERGLSASERKTIDAYVGQRKAGENTVLHFNPNPEKDRATIRRAAGYEEGKKHFLLLTNIVWDSAVQDKDIAFDDMFDWIRTTVEFFRDRPDANLILRIHPAEVKISSDITMERVGDFLDSTIPDMPPNVAVISPESDVSTYDLFEFCDAVLVYTSTVGLESAMERIPTVVCGDTHYTRKGFTLEIETREQYSSMLTELIEEEPKGIANWEAAWTYAYVFFFKCMIPFPFVSESAIGHVGGKQLPSEEELVRGGDKNLDLLCDAVLNGTQAIP